MNLPKQFTTDLVNKNPDDAARLLELYLESGVHAPEIYSVLFDAALKLERTDDAVLILEHGQTKFPNSIDLLVKEARLATIRKDYVTAAAKWAKIEQSNPQIAECYHTGAFCYDQSKNFSSSMQLSRKGLKNHPSSIQIWLQYLNTLLAARNFEAAHACWFESNAQFKPDFRTHLVGAQIAFLRREFVQAKSLLESSVSLNDGTFTYEQSELKRKLVLAELGRIAMHFESLGGSYEGCEFGLVQRSYEAEPLGLLRWTDMKPEALIDALEHEFHGVGEAEHTVLEPPWQGGDWMTKDSRYGMRMHTFQHDNDCEENRSRLFAAACRRLKYLKRKLLEDLASNEKIFIYKITYETLDEKRLHRLHQAIRRYGSATLLSVRQADGPHNAGTVDWIAPGLMVGYIARFSFAHGRHAKYIGPATAEWTTIMKHAFELWEAGKTSPAL